jgi:hypothetical protein
MCEGMFDKLRNGAVSILWIDRCQQHEPRVRKPVEIVLQRSRDNRFIQTLS